MALIQHRHWYKFLRHTFHGDQGELTTPFRELIKKMPGKCVLRTVEGQGQPFEFTLLRFGIPSLHGPPFALLS